MKLRLRSLETKETVRVEVPPQCSLQQLKQTLSQTLSSSAPAPPPESIRLSLNKSDDIQSSSPEEDTLQSLGVTSGDLIFYRTVSQAPTGEDPLARPVSVDAHNSELNLKLETPDAVSDRNPQINPSSIEAESSQKMEVAGGADSSEQKEVADDDAYSSVPMEIDMEIDDDGEEHAVENDMGKAFSVPGFLRKVLTEELSSSDDGGRRNHKLLVTAIHAVFLESGFLGFDMETKNVVTGLLFGNILLGNCLFYTLHGANVKNGLVDDALPYVKLKFQSLGQFLRVYGFLSSDSATYTVCLKEEELVSFFNVVWANCGTNDEIVTATDGIPTTPEKEVFKFWRSVKDDLALPLLIAFCEKLGFGLPPCFARLCTDLKLKILEHLPGVDVARLSCVSSEMRYLGSSDDVWEKKYEEQFGDAVKRDHGQVSWKRKFAQSWEIQKRRKLIHRYRAEPLLRRPRPWLPRRPPSFPVIFYH